MHNLYIYIYIYILSVDYDELYRILPELNGVEPELLLKAARHHLVQGELDRARFYMQGALDRHAVDTEVWAMARGPFRDAGRGLSLGQWMLEYALQVSPDAPHPLRLDAFRQMLDARVAPETLGDPTWVAEQFNAADFNDLGQARLVYEAAIHIQNKPWAYRAAAALEKLLDPSDALYLDVLRTRIEFEETQYDYPAVARIARKLIALGDDSAQDILEKAFLRKAFLFCMAYTRKPKN